MRLRVWAALPVFLLSGCSALEVGRPADWPELRQDGGFGHSCMKDPYVLAVLTAVKDRILDRWALPDGVRAGQSVVIGLIFDANGRVLRTAVFETSNDRLASSALRAIRASEPFEIPPDAVCLAGIPIVGTFTNPARR